MQYKIKKMLLEKAIQSVVLEEKEKYYYRGLLTKNTDKISIIIEDLPQTLQVYLLNNVKSLPSGVRSKLSVHLRLVFKRAEHWQALILFDEVDVFLKQRGDSILQAAIVSVFLRQMDYFHGLMLMTTNRPEVLDYAIRSRVTLRIDYPDHNYELRKAIWLEKLKSANIHIQGDLKEITRIPLNGREIRNIVRLLKILYPDKPSEKKILKVIELCYPEIE